MSDRFSTQVVRRLAGQRRSGQSGNTPVVPPPNYKPIASPPGSIEQVGKGAQAPDRKG